MPKQSQQLRLLVLIESDWNLKFTEAEKQGLIPCVLIESDWNLKSKGTIFHHSAFMVLIESDWNLKERKTLIGKRTVSSINRIRLEFKDYLHGKKMRIVMVLIESDWNLKHYRLTHLLEEGHQY